MDSLWLVVSSILSVFDITKAKGGDGNEIDVTPAYTDSALWYVLLSDSFKSFIVCTRKPHLT